MADFVAAIKNKGLTGALQERDKPFGDYRTTSGTNHETGAATPDASYG